MHQRGPDGRPLSVTDIGAPDERQHANYVIGLLSGGGFPVLVPRSPDLGETYQSHQPPLYYLLHAGWTRVVATDLTNPQQGVMARSLNLVIGGIGIVGVYFCALWGFRDRWLALAAAAMTGLMPMYLALCAAVSNDPLLFAICSWTAALMALGLRNGWTLKLLIGIGVMMGLGFVTKTNALALVPAVAFSLAYATRELKWRLLLPFAIAVGIALPWWVRNTQIYGDPLALGVFADAFVGTAQRSALVEMLASSRPEALLLGSAPVEYWVNWFGWWTLRSFFGAFSQMDIFLPDTLYRLLTALVTLFGLGWVLTLLKKPQTNEERLQRRVVWMLAILFCSVFLLFLRFNLTYFQAQARYLYPATVALSIGFAVGAARLLGNPGRAAALVVPTLLGLNVYVISILSQEFARRWP